MKPGISGKILILVILVAGVVGIMMLNKPTMSDIASTSTTTPASTEASTEPATPTTTLASTEASTESATPMTAAKTLPRFLELGADKCIPCKMMQPILDELRAEYPGKLQVDFIDVWKNPKEADRYNVQGIPTQIFFDANGKEVFRHYGFYPKEDILAKFKELGIAL